MGCIYVIENTVNGKIYVGQTGNWKKRKRDHYRSLKFNKHGNSHLQASWNKYGESSFTFKVIADNLPSQYLDDVERGLIATLRTMHKQYGYNKESGGSLNKKQSQETREKNRQAHLGKRVSPSTEFKKGLIPHNKEKKMPEDWIHPMQGKKHTEESKEKQSQSRRKYFSQGNSTHNKCSVKDSQGRTYSSLTEAAKSLGEITSGNLSNAIKYNKPFKGLYFTKIEPIQNNQFK
jgi:group I intron endonuclease